MKLALAFLAILAFTHAANQHGYPFSNLFRAVAEDSFRIVGGEEVKPHSFPYQVALRIDLGEYETLCGGSIVSSTTVLTAAHCADGAKGIVAMFGQHDLRRPSGTHLQVDKIIIHPAYIKFALLNDIAILRFNKPIEFNENIKAIELPTLDQNSYDFAGEMATVSGWGRFSDGSNFTSPVLRSVDVEVISHDECNRLLGGRILPTQLCADTHDGRSACYGDSGGPLVANEKLIGIVSFGAAFECEIGAPAVFTRITTYVEWISKNSDVSVL